MLTGVAALVTAAGAGAFTAAHVKGGVGDRDEHPVYVGELKNEYRLGIGHLQLDLRDLEVPRGETRVEAHVGFGELDVVLPPRDVAVSVTGEVRWGEANVLGIREEGRGADASFVDTRFRDAPRRLVVEASVRGGELNVSR